MDGEFCYVLDPKKVDAAIAHGEHLRHDEPYRFDVKDSPEPMAYFDPRNGRVVQRIEIPRSAVEKVLALCEEQPFACLFEEERAIYANMVTPELLSVLKHINSTQPPVRPVQEALENPIYMMIPIMTLDEADIMEARVPECELVRWSDGMSFDLTKKGISKVSGIDAILAEYGFSLEEAAAIGDGWNDVGMIGHCGLGIAMGNAKKECKDVADYICPSILEDGIADAIDYILKRNAQE